MIVALDLSLTATGYATSDGRSGVLEPPKNMQGVPRLQWIRFTVMQLALPSELVVLEGYAFAAPNQAHQMGELGGVIRIALADRNKRYVDVAPSSLKMFAAGKGNAKKDEVLAAAIRRLEYVGHNHNESDALWLLEMARSHYALRPGEHHSETKARALSKIKWPALELAGAEA